MGKSRGARSLFVTFASAESASAFHDAVNSKVSYPANLSGLWDSVRTPTLKAALAGSETITTAIKKRIDSQGLTRQFLWHSSRSGRQSD